MFQNVDFNYTNDYNEEKMIVEIEERIFLIKKNLKSRKNKKGKILLRNHTPYVILKHSIGCVISQYDYKFLVDVISYYIGSYYKSDVSMRQMEWTISEWEIDYDNQNEEEYLYSYYSIIAGYLIYNRYLDYFN